MAEEVHPLLLETLKRLEDKVDANTVATNANTTQTAVLTERVDNLKTSVEKHIADDTTIHADHGKQIGSLNLWRTDLKARVATYAAIASVVFGFFFSMAKEAIAAVVTGWGHH